MRCQVRVGRELGGAFERGGRGGRSEPVAAALRDEGQLIGNARVRADGGLGEVPDPGPVTRGEGGGQGPMCRSLLGRGGELEDRAAQQRVPEPVAVPLTDEDAVSACLLQRVVGCYAPVAEHRRDGGGGRSRLPDEGREQDRLPRGGGESGEGRLVVGAQTIARRQRSRERSGPEPLRDIEPLRNLQQGQRIALGPGDEPVDHRRRCARRQEGGGGRRGQATHTEDGQALGELVRDVPRSGGEEEHDGVCSQPACREGDGGRGLGVQPLQVVDEHHHGAAFCGRREQGEGCGSQQEPVGRGGVARPRECGAQGGGLRLRNVVHQVADRVQQAEEAGVRQSGLRLDPTRAEAGDLARPRAGRLEQRRLADPGRALDDQRPAATGSRVGQQRVDARQLAVPPHHLR